MDGIIKILQLEDDENDVEIIRRILLKANKAYEIRHVMTKADFTQALSDFAPDIVISDNNLPQFEGTEALQIVRESYPFTAFILVTGAVSEEFAASIIKLGADDYLLKDRLTRLPAAVEAAIRQRQTERERIAALEKIKRANERYEMIGKATSVALWDWNQETGEVWGNEAHQQFYGRSSHDRVPNHEDWLKRIHPEDRERIISGLARVMASDRRIYVDEYRFYTEHAGWIYVYGRTLIERNAAGKATRLAGSMTDVTDLKNAEASIREREQKYRLLFERNLAGICETNASGRILSCNNAFAQMLGYASNADVVGEDIGLFYFSVAERNRFLEKILRDKQLTNFETVLRHRDGRRLQIIENLSLYEDSISGEPVIEGIIIDISGLKKAEEELRQLQQKMLDQRVQEQKKITRAIIKAQEKERNHIGLELHDNVCQILVGTKLHLGMAVVNKEELKKALAYPMELLDSSINEIRLLSHRLVTPVKDVDLEALMAKLLEDTTRLAPIQTEFAYHLKKSLPDDLKLNIYRIVQEQVNNIVKHAEAQHLYVSVKEENEAIGIVISDDGKGFKLTKKRSGIGISNMLNRIESYNGKMVIKSSPGKGCMVSLKIPVSK